MQEKREHELLDDEVDLEMEQVFVQQDGSIKYCPKIISSLRNYEIKTTNLIPNAQFQDKVNKKIQLFIDDIDFVLGALMNCKGDAANSGRDEGITNLM